MKIPKYNRTNNVDTTMLTIGQKNFLRRQKLHKLYIFGVEFCCLQLL